MINKERQYIRIQTDIPGPKGKQWLDKRNENVPRGTFHVVPTFAQKGKGALLTDIDDNTFIDLAGAIGTLAVGHCPPKVVEAVKKQLDQYIHTSFHVMMYEPYVALAEKINQITPGNHAKKTIFLNSGAEAVENAVKIARKYTGRKAVISFERGFHGRTLLAMSLTSKVKPYKFGFGPFASDIYKLPYPYYYRQTHGIRPEELDQMLLDKLDEFFLSDVSAEEVAAILIEPVQGEGGFVIPSKGFIQGLKQKCEDHGILFIADEIQTGFGRTGKMFAMEHFGVVPDLIALSKSIAAGFPLSAVCGRAEVMDAPSPGEIGGTYGGSPLGCVAALKVIEMIEQEGLLQQSRDIGKQIMESFAKFQAKFPPIGDIRGLGAMCAMEFVKDRQTREPDKELASKVIASCQKKGVIVMGSGLYSNIIRILTPLVITKDQLAEALDVIEEVLEEVLGDGNHS